MRSAIYAALLTCSALIPAAAALAQTEPAAPTLKDRISRRVPVQHRDYQGATHEFFGMDNVVAKAKEAEDAVSADLSNAFAGSPTGSTN